ncbi:MAG: hypothetical protein QM647_01700 [Asticcacaulis sp.]|uniref:hypothetical protein n=1 Tax=Asticcacaulis sp. TaxID=1872648 RepID=UPI0039E37DB0
MSQHSACSSHSQVERGTTLTIRSGALHRNDTLDLEMPEGRTVRAVIERFEPEGLYIHLNGMQLKCRPWRMGDANACRLSGTVSKWTVEQIVADVEPTGAI